MYRTPPDDIFVHNDRDDFFDGLGDVYIDDGVDVDDDNMIDYYFEICDGRALCLCKIPHDGIIMTTAASSFYQQQLYHTCSL